MLKDGEHTGAKLAVPCRENLFDCIGPPQEEKQCNSQTITQPHEAASLFHIISVSIEFFKWT